MTDNPQSKPMDVFDGDPRMVDTDLVIAAAFEGQASALTARWNTATGGGLDHAIAT
jgi:hypothetical protein